MTSAPQVPPLRFETLEGAVAAMRERGLRLSTARRLILEDLFGADGPVSAEYVATRLHLDLASLSIAEFCPDGASSVRLVNQTGYLG